MSEILTPCVSPPKGEVEEGIYMSWSCDEYDFIDGDPWPSIIFKAIHENRLVECRYSFRRWLENEYGLEYQKDFQITDCDYAYDFVQWKSISIWFLDKEAYVMLKITYD